MNKDATISIIYDISGFHARLRAMPASPAVKPEASATPILDRLQPLPKARKARSYAVFFQVVPALTLLFLVALSALFSGLQEKLNYIHAPGPGLMSWALFFLAVIFMPITIHELGHLLIGKWAGFRFRYFRVGPIRIDRPFRFSRSKDHQYTVSGAVAFFPLEMKNHPWK